MCWCLQRNIEFTDSQNNRQHVFTSTRVQMDLSLQSESEEMTERSCLFLYLLCFLVYVGCLEAGLHNNNRTDYHGIQWTDTDSGNLFHFL